MGKRCKRVKVSCEAVRRVDGRKLRETKRWERKTSREKTGVPEVEHEQGPRNECVWMCDEGR